MKTQMGIFVGLLMLLCISMPAMAQQTDAVPSDSSVVMRFRIFYPVNESDIHEDYMDNANQLQSIRKHLEKSRKIDSITIYSYASPDGPYRLNKRLATERGKTAREYLLSCMPAGRSLSESMIVLNPTVENWEGLRNLVYYQYGLDDKKEVLDILDRNDITDGRRKVLLKRLNNGKSWQYIIGNLMPQLRYATWISVWEPVQAERAMAEPVRLAVDLPPLSLPQWQPVQVPTPVMEEKETKTVLALKSNLLYDALTALNVEVEVPIGNKWSVAVENVFPWWNHENKWAFQMWEMGVEGRYWFKRTPSREVLSGCFGGLYAMSAIYDFQWRRDLNYQGEYWSAGLTAGYAWPVSKLFNLELSASVGYLSTAYSHYLPSPGYEELVRDPYKQGRMGYFGPTKLKVALVFPINITVGKRKGGAR